MPISVRLGSMVFRVSVVYDNESPTHPAAGATHRRNVNVGIIIYKGKATAVATETVIIKNAAASSSGAEI